MVDLVGMVDMKDMVDNINMVDNKDKVIAMFQMADDLNFVIGNLES
jgi:hypothetical protein